MEASPQHGLGANGSNGMSRAEKFEDEKRRIVESCFGKKDDADGAVLESYITHIRIIEDGAYPSTVPPPNSDTAAKKPRLIIVAVRKSGRVRMHKARENVNGTFSIGKTWTLDELSAVRSFNGSIPTSAEEELQKQWAGGTGFIVTIGKPYYWQANTQKEKQFFIASLVKIYTKYTGGKSPDLIGFDAREKDQLLEAATRSLPQSQTQSPATSAPPSGLAQSARPRREPSREPVMRPPSSRDGIPRSGPPMQPPATSPYGTPQTRPRSGRDGSPASNDPGTGLPQTQATNLRRIAGNQSQESFGRSDESLNMPPRSRGGSNGMHAGPGRFQDRSGTPSSQRSTTPDSGLPPSRDSARDAPPVPTPLAIPPERRRPPMPLPGSSRGGSNDNMVPAPLASASPGTRKEDLRLPLRSIDRPSRDPQDSASPTSQTSNGLGPAMPRQVLESQKAETPTEESRSPQNGPSIPLPQPPSSSTPAESPAQEPELRPGLGPMIKNKSSNVSPVSPEEPEARPGLGPMIKNKPSNLSPTSPEETEVVERPGLGPMIKQKKSKSDIANTFLKAAKTANAFSSFKPRAGGAAERLREAAAKAQDKALEGPDGITGVVPAPSLIRAASDLDSIASTPIATPVENKLSKGAEILPEVKITVPQSDRPGSAGTPIKGPEEGSQEKTKLKESKRPKAASEVMHKELILLGIDPSILGGRGNDLVDLWDEFGWVGEGVHTKSIDQMKDEIERELNRVQAGGWLERVDEEDDRIEAIQKGLDTCIEECDELDGLLTLYMVEMSTLNEDIAYIEAQGQGLQVQAANQKLLKIELESLLKTISISPKDLASLREASMETVTGLEQIEDALVMLYKAMLTIDPTLSTSGPRPSEDGSLRSNKPESAGISELGNMKVLQEKKDVYNNDSSAFLHRFKTTMEFKFAAAIDETRKALEREKNGQIARAGKAKLDSRNHDLAREVLWRYSPLMLFAREVNRKEWEDMMKSYETKAKPLYQDEFRDMIFSWKRVAKKPTGDEGDILFTSQIEKQTEGIATTARKLTVKRSQTLAKSLRSPIGDNSSKSHVDRDTDARLPPSEVFAGVLEEIIPIMSMEQNFIVEFFHVTSLEQHDFTEAVFVAPPDLRRGTDLKRPRVMDPNRDLAREAVQAMDEVFSFFQSDIQSLVDWSLKDDPLQGVGLIVAIERKLLDFEESNQEFLAKTFQKLHTLLVGLFNKFLNEQIRAIEDTKVKIKKRKGVIGFVRIFPMFSLKLEKMLASAEDLEIRETVDQAYVKINKTMFESLKVIARENPSAQTAGADPEDKEALNFQILLIENMHHYLEELDVRSNPVLEDWKQNAAQEMDEHMTLYLDAVIRRPLGKLLDFLESTESLMHSRQPGEPASKISSMPSHSKVTFKKILAGYDSKEIKKGIEILKKRVEKHFGDADDPGLSRGLVAKVQQNCEKYYEKVEDRILTISRDVYDGDVIADWNRADVSGAFRR